MAIYSRGVLHGPGPRLSLREKSFWKIFLLDQEADEKIMTLKPLK